MKPLRFFLPPDRWFALVERLAADLSLEVIFRRAESSEHEAGFHLAGLGTLKQVYEEGGYSQIVFSVGTVPAHDQDWRFVMRARDEILECDGGNWQQRTVGIRTLWLLSKRSKALPVFKEFRRAIAEMCQQGMVAGETVHADVFYYPDPDWTYKSLPEKDATEYKPI